MNKKHDHQEQSICLNNAPEDFDVYFSEFKENLLKPARDKLNRVYLGPYYPAIYFTRREMECAEGLLSGKTIKEIAKSMDISYRSVEFYLKNMRLKVNASTKKELINIVRNKTSLAFYL